MSLFANLDVGVSRVRPLWYLLVYLTAIPIFGFLFAYVAPHGFYAPYARYEPGAVADRAELAAMLEGALRRSMERNRTTDQFVIDDWKLDLDSLRVDDVDSADGTKMSFRVRFSANGTGKLEGARQLGWSIIASVPESPTSAKLYRDSVVINRFPEVDFSKYISPFKDQNEKLFRIIFSQQIYGFDMSAPALALNDKEDLQFRRYLQAIKGDPSAASGHLWRMIYLSAVVITTLGLGDIVPITWQARTLVASEAIGGIVLAGFFLNALAFRASGRKV